MSKPKVLLLGYEGGLVYRSLLLNTYIYLNAPLAQKARAVGGIAHAYNVLDSMTFEFLTQCFIQIGSIKERKKSRVVPVLVATIDFR